MNRPAFPAGNKLKSGDLADWIERCVIEGRASFKRGDLNTALNVEVDGETSLLESQTWDELKLRESLFGDSRPVQLSGDRLELREIDASRLTLYRYLCLLSSGQIDNADRTIFEEVVLAIVAPSFGGNALRIGHPASAGMDRSFRRRVDKYVADSEMSIHEVGVAPTSDDKDLGLDVVAWWSMADRRGAEQHFLFQCATGADWPEKLAEIDLDVLVRHIAWGVKPVRVFCVPNVISVNQVKWIRFSTKAGVLLDRPRLLELSSRATLPEDLVVLLEQRLVALAA